MNAKMAKRLRAAAREHAEGMAAVEYVYIAHKPTPLRPFPRHTRVVSKQSVRGQYLKLKRRAAA